MASPHATLPRHATLIPADDAIAMLTADHHKVRALFQQYQDMDDPDSKRCIAEALFAALALHATLEEMVFYPAVAAYGGAEGHRLIAGARQDHQEFRELITAVRQCDAAAFEPRLYALMTLVEQHMAAEEAEMFPWATEHLAEHLDALRKTMQKLQQRSGTS